MVGAGKYLSMPANVHYGLVRLISAGIDKIIFILSKGTIDESFVLFILSGDGVIVTQTDIG